MKEYISVPIKFFNWWIISAGTTVFVILVLIFLKNGCAVPHCSELLSRESLPSENEFCENASDVLVDRIVLLPAFGRQDTSLLTLEDRIVITNANTVNAITVVLRHDETWESNFRKLATGFFPEKRVSNRILKLCEVTDGQCKAFLISFHVRLPIAGYRLFADASCNEKWDAVHGDYASKELFDMLSGVISSNSVGWIKARKVSNP